MIKSEIVGTLYDDTGEPYADTVVTIEPERVNVIEFAAIINELRHRGCPYEAIIEVIDAVYDDNVVERMTDEELKCYRN